MIPHEYSSTRTTGKANSLAGDFLSAVLSARGRVSCVLSRSRQFQGFSQVLAGVTERENILQMGLDRGGLLISRLKGSIPSALTKRFPGLQVKGWCLSSPDEILLQCNGDPRLNTSATNFQLVATQIGGIN
jgi:hypothetical protein